MTDFSFFYFAYKSIGIIPKILGWFKKRKEKKILEDLCLLLKLKIKNGTLHPELAWDFFDAALHLISGEKIAIDDRISFIISILQKNEMIYSKIQVPCEVIVNA